MTKKSKKTNSKKPINVEVEANIKVQRQLRDKSYMESMTRVRKRLPTKRQRALSKLIHAKGMDYTHDVWAITLARPISIIAGSSLALIGSLIGIYYSSHYGYNYNYFLVVIFFIIGYVLELIIELIISLIIAIIK